MLRRSPRLQPSKGFLPAPTLWEHCGMPSDETIPDEARLELAERNDWAVLMKDTRSRAPRSEPDRHSVLRARYVAVRWWLESLLSSMPLPLWVCRRRRVGVFVRGRLLAG